MCTISSHKKHTAANKRIKRVYLIGLFCVRELHILVREEKSEKKVKKNEKKRGVSESEKEVHLVGVAAKHETPTNSTQI